MLYAGLARGLSFKIGQGNVIVLSPPLIITRDELDRALDLLEGALTDAADPA